MGSEKYREDGWMADTLVLHLVTNSYTNDIRDIN